MKPASLFGIFLIRLYQAAVSPVLGPAKCRFYPTCSEYAAESLARYGLFYGSYIALRRVLRCGPWSKGGYDPVPEPDEVKRILPGSFFKRTSKG